MKLRLRVFRCCNCPLFSVNLDYHCVVTDKKIDVNATGFTPPAWCPLREGDVVVTTDKQEEDA